VRIAIFHDYFGAIGGGEKVVIEMAKILDADIITTDTDAIHKIDPTVRVISLGKTLKLSPLKQISATFKFYFCNFSQNYDVFIFSGNWAHYAAHRHHPNIWYCHTPARMFYDLHETFAQRLNPGSRLLFRLWSFLHRKWDQQSVRAIDQILANSYQVQSRILHYYHRDSIVLYPPVDTRRFFTIETGNFWLSVNRLYPEKRIDLQINCFRKMAKERLIIIGGYAEGDHAQDYARDLYNDLPPNVIIAGEVSEEELRNHYARCKGLICTAFSEDFGLTPLEAMASGKPIVAVKEGGFCETITSETGILVPPEEESIIKAVRAISKNPGLYRDACICRAQQFDISVFAEKLRKKVHEISRIA